MIKILAAQREQDDWGSGKYGASRGTRKHQGIDYACAPSSMILSPCIGKVSKLGYPYSDDLTFRYVEVEREDKLLFRVFYVTPLVDVGDYVHFDTIIGASQKLGKRYKGITEHVHFEIKDENGVIQNPMEILK